MCLFVVVSNVYNVHEGYNTIPERSFESTFCGFSMGRNQYWAGRVYDLCVYYMTGTPEGSTESGFMEKPGIEPATPGLQGIALIHYTTGASLRNFEPIGAIGSNSISRVTNHHHHPH